MLDARNLHSRAERSVESQERTSKINIFGIFKDIKNYILIINIRKTNPNGEKFTHPPNPQIPRTNNTVTVGYL